MTDLFENLLTERSLYQTKNQLQLYQRSIVTTFIGEIPSELSRLNMISLHVKITCYFTRENVIFSSEKTTIAIVI